MERDPLVNVVSSTAQPVDTCVEGCDDVAFLVAFVLVVAFVVLLVKLLWWL